MILTIFPSEATRTIAFITSDTNDSTNTKKQAHKRREERRTNYNHDEAALHPLLHLKLVFLVPRESPGICTGCQRSTLQEYWKGIQKANQTW